MFDHLKFTQFSCNFDNYHLDRVSGKMPPGKKLTALTNVAKGSCLDVAGVVDLKFFRFFKDKAHSSASHTR